MSAFDEREKAFEAKYHLDQDIAFKVNARRDKLLGLWAAERFGLKGDEAQAYARSVLEADFAGPGHAAMLKKLADDFLMRDVLLEDGLLERQMDRLLVLAKEQILAEIVAGKTPLSPE